jgi:hypothetical protein
MSTELEKNNQSRAEQLALPGRRATSHRKTHRSKIPTEALAQLR